VTDQRAAGLRQASIGLLVLTAVLLASAAVGFITYRLVPRAASIHTAAAMPAPPATATSDTEIPARSPTTAQHKLPVELPEIRLPGTDGAPHRLADWTGRPLVINFWATWCEPCRREIPLLTALRREYAADRLEIVGIAVDYPEDVQKYVQGHGIDYPVLVGDKDGLAAANAFGMDTVLPFSVFADGQGRVVTLKVGELRQDEAGLILDRVREIDAGKLSLPLVRERISEGVRRLRTARATE